MTLRRASCYPTSDPPFALAPGLGSHKLEKRIYIQCAGPSRGRERQRFTSRFGAYATIPCMWLLDVSSGPVLLLLLVPLLLSLLLLGKLSLLLLLPFALVFLSCISHAYSSLILHHPTMILPSSPGFRRRPRAALSVGGYSSQRGGHVQSSTYPGNAALDRLWKDVRSAAFQSTCPSVLSDLHCLQFICPCLESDLIKVLEELLRSCDHFFLFKETKGHSLFKLDEIGFDIDNLPKRRAGRFGRFACRCGCWL
jgi:hypothetical protein